MLKTDTFKASIPAFDGMEDWLVGWKIGCKIGPVGELASGENNNRILTVVLRLSWGHFSLSLRNLAQHSGSGMERSGQNNWSKFHPIETPTAYPEILL